MRSTLHRILSNLHYIGECQYQGAWHPGKFEALIDSATWRTVQQRLRGKTYHVHRMTFAGGLLRYAHCGHVVTGEAKRKTKSPGERVTYTYYRCSKYNRPNHPRERVTAATIESQLLDVLARMRLSDPEIRAWFVAVIKARARASQQDNSDRRQELQRQRDDIDRRLARLLEIRIDDEIDRQTYSRTRLELADERSSVLARLESLDRDSDETADLWKTRIFLEKTPSICSPTVQQLRELEPAGHQ
jgi:hypothetical protein